MKVQYLELSSPSRNCGAIYTVDEVLFSGRSEFQKVDFYRTRDYGVVFTLDNIVQLAEHCEFFYHEMMVHPALLTHPAPKKVLVIGGGDCGTIKQVIKHPVEQVVMVEIDGLVVEQCKKHYPALTSALDDKRVELRIEDGFAYMANCKNEFDVIICDSTDPDTIATDLFSGDFYSSVFEALTEDGIFVAQSEPPFHADYNSLQQRVYGTLRKTFAHVNFLYFPMQCYPTGFFTAIMASKKADPRSVSRERIASTVAEMGLRYYNEDIHHAALAVPNYMKQKLAGL